MFSATVAAQQRRPLRNPRDALSPGGRVARGEIDAVHADSPGRGLDQAEQQRGDRALPRAALADERNRLAGRQLEREAVEHETRAGRIRERDAFQPHGNGGRARRHTRTARAALGRGVEQREDPLRDRDPVRARVVLRAEPSDRQVELGSEHEHGQPGLAARCPRPRGARPRSPQRAPRRSSPPAPAPTRKGSSPAGCSSSPAGSAR